MCRILRIFCTANHCEPPRTAANRCEPPRPTVYIYSLIKFHIVYNSFPSIKPPTGRKPKHCKIVFVFLSVDKRQCTPVSMSEKEEALTAGELLRRRAQKKPSRSSSSSSSNEETAKPSGDIDDEIKRLEAELAKESGSDSDSSSDSDDDSSSSSSSESENKVVDDSRNTGVLSLSALEKDRIESLPSHLLPAARKRSLKVDAKSEKGPKKKEKQVENGLASAVKEVLSGYVARSSERLPFYCRFCQKQYTNEQEFFGHKQTEFHKTAVEVERKASYCKLCRKQLTSPEQLKEHLTSRPHKERLEHARSRNPPGRGRGRGRGHEGRSRGRGRSSKTAWTR